MKYKQVNNAVIETWMMSLFKQLCCLFIIKFQEWEHETFEKFKNISVQFSKTILLLDTNSHAIPK